MAEVVWTLQALEDLDAVCGFIGRDSGRVAELFAHRALHATDRLATFPLSGRVVPEFGREDIREVLLDAYRLLYRLRGEIVEILTVHHSARLLSSWE